MAPFSNKLCYHLLNVEFCTEHTALQAAQGVRWHFRFLNFAVSRFVATSNGAATIFAVSGTVAY